MQQSSERKIGMQGFSMMLIMITAGVLQNVRWIDQKFMPKLVACRSTFLEKRVPRPDSLVDNALDSQARGSNLPYSFLDFFCLLLND